MSQVAYQSKASAQADNANSTNSLTLNIAKPTGLAIGDTMIAQVNAYIAIGIAALQLPAGWTLVHPIVVQSTLNDLKAWKTADASDVSASTFAFSATGTGSNGQILMEGAIYRYTNAHPTSPVNAQSNSNGNSPGSTTLTVGAITPTESSLLLELLSWNRASGGVTVSGYAVTTTNPTWTERIDENNTAFSVNAGVAMADASRTALTSTGSGSAVVSSTVANYSLTLISLSPAPIRPATFLGATFGIRPVIIPILPSAFGATFGILQPVVDIIAPLWRNDAKHDSSWIDEPKS